MDIGTAKPNKEERNRIPHHFIDSLDLTDKYNVGSFEEEVLQKIKILFDKHDILFLTGGSGLYLDAVCNGIDILPESDPEIREALNKFYKEEGIEALRKKLLEADPEYYSTVDINNPHRLIRALEVTIQSGKKYSFSLVSLRHFLGFTKRSQDLGRPNLGGEISSSPDPRQSLPKP